MKNVATESAAAVAAVAAGSEVAVVVLAAASGLVKSIMGDVRVRVWKQNNSIRGMSKLKMLPDRLRESRIWPRFSRTLYSVSNIYSAVNKTNPSDVLTQRGCIVKQAVI